MEESRSKERGDGDRGERRRSNRCCSCRGSETCSGGRKQIKASGRNARKCRKERRGKEGRRR